MLCTNCGERQATVHITRSINGITREYWLCPECASKVEMSTPFAGFDSLLKSAFPFSLGSVRKTKQCPECGCTFDEIMENSLLGCAKCYEYFAEELKPVIGRLHANASYVPNSVSAPMEEKKPAENELETLKKRLKKAVDEEDYELAAKLRDEIKAKEAKDK